MIPAAFEYEVAESPEHALDLLAGHGGDARVLAGGQSLLPLMKLRLATPSLLVDIGRIDGFEGVREDGDSLVVGALTRHEDVARSDLVQEHSPLLAKAAAEIGDPQVRHMGTAGGSVAHGDPASDVPAVLLALDGELVARSSSGSRTIAARDFFTGTFETALEPHELLTEIRVPKLSGVGCSYVKFHPRAQDWAIVGVAAVVHPSNGGVGRAAIALTNMGATPLRATAVEQALAQGADASSAAASAAEGTDPVSDAFASSDYRRHLAPVLVRRALEAALAR